jgi:CRISPR-associated endoribonuclease Cas6
MRLKIKFNHPEKNFITLPCHYNEIIQGFIYRNLDRWLSEKIHEQGFKDPETERKLKFFTFSRLIPDEKIYVKDGKINLYGNLKLIVSSPIQDFIQSFAMNLMKAGTLRLGKEDLILSSVEVEGLPQYQEKIYVRTLSPITVYSTLEGADGKKKTYYYSPFEKEFEDLMIKNLQRKLRTWAGSTIFSGSIKAYKVNSKDQKIVIYKETVIKGWDGVFELNLPRELFNMAFETGLGAKNSLGFGCIEVWKPFFK